MQLVSMPISEATENKTKNFIYKISNGMKDP